MSQGTAGSSVEGEQSPVASQAEHLAENQDLALAYRLSLVLAVVAVVAQVFGHLHDPAASPGAVPVFVVLTLIGLVPTAALLRGLRPDGRVV